MSYQLMYILVNEGRLLPREIILICTGKLVPSKKYRITDTYMYIYYMYVPHLQLLKC